MKQKNNVIIRDAEISFALKISEIEKECFSAPWSKKQIEDEIIKDNVIFITALIDNNVVGYVSGQMIIDEFYISNIAVTAEHRNSGIGKLLISSLIDKLKNSDCSFATLEVRQSNFAAISLYEKLGFKNLGIRKNFYTSPIENACIFTLFFKNVEGE